MASLLTVDGLTSGLRTSEIIDQLMAIERRPIDRITQQRTTAQKRIKALQDLNNALRKLRSALDKLTERERMIMELRFGLYDGEEKTQKDVADMLGISQSYISRLEKRIIKRLRKEFNKMV